VEWSLKLEKSRAGTRELAILPRLAAKSINALTGASTLARGDAPFRLAPTVHANPNSSSIPLNRHHLSTSPSHKHSSIISIALPVLKTRCEKPRRRLLFQCLQPRCLMVRAGGRRNNLHLNSPELISHNANASLSNGGSNMESEFGFEHPVTKHYTAIHSLCFLLSIMPTQFLTTS
jgi:hypothetical protein